MSLERDERLKSVENQDEDQRSPFRRDRDRILYSKAFRRLSGVTQVARVGESYFYHDRLSHSLKVSQVARSLAEILLEERSYNEIDIGAHLDPDVVETAALGHDLGHPPFGHAAEQELNELVDDAYGGFEGNAQSFRILTNAELHRESDPGLNLTLASYNAVLKYPWGHGEKDDHGSGDKWGYYPTESEHFEKVREVGPDTAEMSLEAEIMDYADDLTYAIHDLDDFYRAGLIPLDQLLSGTKERGRVKEFINEEEDIKKSKVDNILDTLKKQMTTGEELLTPFRGTDSEIAALNSFTSNLIQKYLAPFNPTEMSVDEDTISLDVYDKTLEEISVLKSLTLFYVIDNTSLMSQQYGQRKIIREIFECLTDAAHPEKEHGNVIPLPYRNRIKNLDNHQEMKRKRIVVDLITSMTEKQALSFYQRLEGDIPGSLREGILR